jgi:hypothetical protein
MGQPLQRGGFLLQIVLAAVEPGHQRIQVNGEAALSQCGRVGGVPKLTLARDQAGDRLAQEVAAAQVDDAPARTMQPAQEHARRQVLRLQKLADLNVKAVDRAAPTAAALHKGVRRQPPRLQNLLVAGDLGMGVEQVVEQPGAGAALRKDDEAHPRSRRGGQAQVGHGFLAAQVQPCPRTHLPSAPRLAAAAINRR